MQTIVYQCDTAMPAQKLPNCCILNRHIKTGISLIIWMIALMYPYINLYIGNTTAPTY